MPIEPEPPRPIALPPVYDPEVLRVLAVGSRPVVNRFVRLLHRSNIAPYSEWSQLIPTPNPGEFMRMLTKRIPLQADDFDLPSSIAPPQANLAAVRKPPLQFPRRLSGVLSSRWQPPSAATKRFQTRPSANLPSPH